MSCSALEGDVEADPKSRDGDGSGKIRGMEFHAVEQHI